MAVDRDMTGSELRLQPLHHFQLCTCTLAAAVHSELLSHLHLVAAHLSHDLCQLYGESSRSRLEKEGTVHTCLMLPIN